MDRSTDGLLVVGLIGLVLLVTSVGPCKEITSREPDEPATRTEQLDQPPVVIVPELEPALAPPTLSVSVLREAGWKPVAPGGMPRSRATAIELGDGRILVAGGADAAGAATRESWLVPSSGIAFPTGPMAQPRAGAQALRTTLGWTVVVGGSDEETASAELWDAEDGAWKPGGRLIARSGFALAAMPDGRVLAAGGAGAGDETLTDVQLLDTSVGQWLPAEPLRQPRRDAAAVVLVDGRVLVTGGVGADGRTRNDSELRATDGTWTVGPRMVTARAGHAAVRLSDGRVLIAGGAAGAAELFDPATNAFTPAGQAASLDRGLSLFATPDGGAIAVAGTVEGCVTAAVEQWSPATSGWTRLAGAPCGASVVPGPIERLYAIGGAPAPK